MPEASAAGNDVPGAILGRWQDFPLAGTVQLEANAGTGKTYALVHWVLRLVVETGIDLKDVVLVTFTDRACDELRARLAGLLMQAESLLDAPETATAATRELAAWLNARAEAPGGDRLRRALAHARHSADLAQVHTIHGFAQRCLAEFAGIRAAEVVGARQVLTESVRDSWRRLLVAEAAEPFPMHALFPGPDEVVAALLRMAERLVTPPAPVPDRRAALVARVMELGAGILDARDRVTALIEPREGRSPIKVDGVAHVRALVAALEARHWITLVELDVAEVADWPNKSMKGPRDTELLERFAAFEQARADLRQHLYTLLGQRMLVDFLAHLGRLHDERRCLRHADLILLLRQRVESDPRFLAALRGRYRHVLIDEFQDTDADQLAIFRAIFGGDPRRLFGMIGDPKQSIYGFRGADLGVYLEARRAEGLVRGRLARNFRSRPAMVAAVNTLFAAPDAFLDPELRMAPSESARSPDYVDARHPDAPALIDVAVDDGDTLEACADWLADAIHSGRFRRETPLRAADFAILVRRNADAESLAGLLARRGLSANLKRTRSVLKTPAADDLAVLLAALESIDAPDQRRAAWILPWFGVAPGDLAELPPARAQDLLLDLRGLAEAITADGLATALAPRLPAASAAAIRQGKGPQWSVDSMHLLELLADAPRSVPATRERLVAMRGLADSGGEESEDWRARPAALEDAVTVATVHGAKGLEFPVVLLPSLFDVKRARKDERWILGDDRRLAWQAEADGRDQRAAEAEERRIAYVALTRAALATVVFRPPVKKEPSLMSQLVAGRAPDWPTFLEAAATEAPTVFARETAVSAGAIVSSAPVQAPRLLPRPVPPPASQVASFSSLRAGGVALLRDRSVPAGPAGDEHASPLAVDGLDPGLATADPELVALQTLRGTGFGDVVHKLLEAALSRDARWPDESEWLHALARLGLDPPAQRLHRAPLERLLHRVLATPLGPLPPLASLAAGTFATEFGFDLAVRPFRMADLVKLFERHGYDDCAAALTGQSGWRGLLTGSADLVCCHGDRFHVVDYKTNWLGARARDYAPPALLQAMREGQYRLQYLIYLVALHRHLRQRLGPAYAPERQLGGALYVFVRGVGIAPGDGLYADVPPVSMIDALGDVLVGRVADVA